MRGEKQSEGRQLDESAVVLWGISPEGPEGHVQDTAHEVVIQGYDGRGDAAEAIEPGGAVHEVFVLTEDGTGRSWDDMNEMPLD